MKKAKFKTILTAAALCVACAGLSAGAATQPSTERPAATTTVEQNPQVVSEVTQLIGAPVENPEGRKLGTIKNLVVDFSNNKVTYCVMSVKHGIFGSSRLVAVPLNAFQPSANGTHLILNASRANLARARRFDRSDWPVGMNSAWGAEPGTTPENLPPVVVFAPTVAALPPAANIPPEDPWVSDPAWGIPPAPQTLTQQFRTFHYMIINGYPLMAK